MSRPWRFAGTWFPFVEDTIAATDIGDGTAYPVTWDRTDGATTSNEMCQFEWSTKTVRRRADGTVAVTLTNPNPPFNTAQVTVPFSFDQSVTPDAGADWSVLEPADLTVGGRLFAFTDESVTVPVITPWGPSTVTVTYAGDGAATGHVSWNYGVIGSDSGGDGNFTQYVKQFANIIQVQIGLAASTDPGSLGPSAVSTGFSSTLFHGTGTVYQIAAVGTGDGFSFTRFSYEVTDNFTAPANI